MVILEGQTGGKVMKTGEFFKTMAVKTAGLFHIHGFDIEAERKEDAKQIVFSAPVFYGGNYIPNSVRMYLRRKGFIAHDAFSEVALVIDEENYRVALSYQTKWEGDKDGFIDRIEAFLTLADEWRTILNDQGEQDLIHILINR